MNIILIEIDGTTYEKHIKTLDKLYSVCGYRSNKDFEKLHDWYFDNKTYELYGKKKVKRIMKIINFRMRHIMGHYVL